MLALVQWPRCLPFNHMHLEGSIPGQHKFPTIQSTSKLTYWLLGFFFFFFLFLNFFFISESHARFSKDISKFLFWKLFFSSLSLPDQLLTLQAPHTTCSPVSGFLIQMFFCLSTFFCKTTIFSSTRQKYWCEGTLQWSHSGFNTVNHDLTH